MESGEEDMTEHPLGWFKINDGASFHNNNKLVFSMYIIETMKTIEDDRPLWSYGGVRRIG